MSEKLTIEELAYGLVSKISGLHRIADWAQEDHVEKATQDIIALIRAVVMEEAAKAAGRGYWVLPSQAIRQEGEEP